MNSFDPEKIAEIAKKYQYMNHQLHRKNLARINLEFGLRLIIVNIFLAILILLLMGMRYLQ